MAERRMFNKVLMFSDLFTRLHHNAKLLYIYINLHADDDGICGNPQALARLYGCSKSHIQALIDGGWLLPFDTGEVAVAHWHLHNQIRKDRHRPSICTHVTKQLKKGPDGIYVIAVPGCQDDNQPVANLSTTPATQERIGQDSLDQDSPGQDSPGQDRPGKAIQAEPGCPSSGPLNAACADSPKARFYFLCLCLGRCGGRKGVTIPPLPLAGAPPLCKGRLWHGGDVNKFEKFAEFGNQRLQRRK